MVNKTINGIKKLSDESLENVSGGGRVLSTRACSNLETAGEAIAGIGMLGYGICKVASSVCEAKGSTAATKYLDTAKNICKGLAGLGGAAYIGGKLG